MLSEKPSGSLKASSHGHGPQIRQHQPLPEPGRARFLPSSFLWQYPPWPVCQDARHRDCILHPPITSFSPGGKDSLQEGRSLAQLAPHALSHNLMAFFHIKPSPSHSKNSGWVGVSSYFLFVYFCLFVWETGRQP